MLVKKRQIGQKVIVPGMKDADNDNFLFIILFTMKAIEMKLSRDVYGAGLHLMTI